jgi:hypothetical protein
MKTAIILGFLVATLSIDSFGQHIPLCHENRISSLGTVSNLSEFIEKNLDCDPKDNRVALKLIDSLVKLTGQPLRFTVCKTRKIQNAFAAMDSLGHRSIVYDEDFLRSLDSDSARWETLTVLAHEIGHHLAAHTLFIVDENYKADRQQYCDPSAAGYDATKCTDVYMKYLALCREQELEADRIGGYLMFRYGATLDQISSLYVQIAWNIDDKNSDHPSLNKRIEAAKAGYQLGAAQRASGGGKVRIEQLKGTQFDFVFKRLNIIERNQLLDKIRASVRIQPFQNISNSSKYRYSINQVRLSNDGYQGIRDYLGKKDAPLHVDNDSAYFDLIGEAFVIRDDPRISYGPVIGIDVKKNELKIVQFLPTSIKILIRCPFTENDIPFDTITEMMTSIYRNGLQKEIDRNY